MLRWIRFSAALLALGTVWMVVLPRLGQWHPVRETVGTLEAAGVDPCAMFYTELTQLPEILARMEAARNKHPEAFWGGWAKRPTHPAE